MTIRALRQLSKAESLAQFQAHPELAGNVSAAARQWGCSRATARQRIAEWTAAGGDTVAVIPAPPAASTTAMATVSLPASPPWQSGPTALAAYVAAVALAGTAASFSVSGMVVLFPGAPVAIVAMALAMEAGKLVTVGWLAHHWQIAGYALRAVLVMLVTGLAAINAAGVYSQLVAAHLADRVTATASAESEATRFAARIEVQAAAVADFVARLRQIDSAISEMTRRGSTTRALDAIGMQRKARDALVAQRRHEAEALAALKADQGAAAPKARAVEVEAAPIVYVAALFGGTTEQAIRLLILLMVLTCDPLAIALTAAAAMVRGARAVRRIEGETLLFMPGDSSTLATVKYMGASVTVGSLVAATTVRAVWAGGFCATAEPAIRIFLGGGSADFGWQNVTFR
jgi:hypothetical protein